MLPLISAATARDSSLRLTSLAKDEERGYQKVKFAARAAAGRVVSAGPGNVGVSPSPVDGVNACYRTSTALSGFFKQGTKQEIEMGERSKDGVGKAIAVRTRRRRMSLAWSLLGRKVPALAGPWSGCTLSTSAVPPVFRCGLSLLALVVIERWMKHPRREQPATCVPG